MNRHRKRTIKKYHRHVGNPLKIRLGIYLFILIGILGVVAYRTYFDGVPILYPIGALLIGFALGIAIARTSKITWDKGAKQVISRMDTLGILILVLYISFEIQRDVIVGYFIEETNVVTISFSILAGIMTGRIVGIGRKVHRVLDEYL